MRGVFVVFEGIDGCGKSSQIKKLQSVLIGKNIPTECLACPDRKTKLGSVINDYLKGRDTEIEPAALHLLFSASRWEMQAKIHDLLNSGVTVLCDRYAYSGVVYSFAVHNLDLSWCMEPDKGLIKPDVVYQLVADPFLCSKRLGYGSEVYEKLDLQKKVQDIYSLFHKCNNWHVVDSTAADYLEKIIPVKEGDIDRREQENANIVSDQINQISEKILEHFLKIYTSIHNSEDEAPLEKLGEEHPW